MIKDYSYLESERTSTSNIHGYIILGERKGKYFHIYDGQKEVTLFTADTNTVYNVKSELPLRIFVSRKDAIEDAIALRKACYNDDFGLDICVCKCMITTGIPFKPGKFVGYEAYESNSLIIDLTDKTLNHID